MKFKSPGYLRFHRQLMALKKNDLYTVKRLATEAKQYLQLKRRGTIQLALS